MKTLEEFANLIHENMESPGVLSYLQVEMSADYAYLAAILRPIKEDKGTEWIAIKMGSIEGQKPHSDKMTEMLWRQTEKGRQEYGIEMKMKALEKMMTAIKSNTYIANAEARNQMFHFPQKQ